MKCEVKKKKGFEPVIITLETEDELIQLYHILDTANNSSLEKSFESAKKEARIKVYAFKQALFRKLSNVWWSI